MLKYKLDPFKLYDDVIKVEITVYDQYDDVGLLGQLHNQDGVTIWQSELIGPDEWMALAVAFNAALVEAYTMLTYTGTIEDEAPIPFSAQIC